MQMLSMILCVVQSENLDNSMDQSNASATSQDCDDDKSVIVQYEGKQRYFLFIIVL